MAKLIIDGKEHGIHAFVIQLRSLENHQAVPGKFKNNYLKLLHYLQEQECIVFNENLKKNKGVELGDIGKKAGFESQDNGYVKFTNLRIPRFNMYA
jgi:acyl-CoA oxidase